MTFCCMCRFFLICTEMQILDGDDLQILSILYRESCPSFEAIRCREDIFGRECEVTQ